MEKIKDPCTTRIKQARAARGLSQTDLAKLIDRAFRTVSDWERGKSYPTIQDLRKISEALGVRLSWLVADGETMEMKQ